MGLSVFPAPSGASGQQLLTLRHTITNSGSVTIPAEITQVYAIVIGGGQGGSRTGNIYNAGVGGYAGSISQGWTASTSSVTVGAGGTAGLPGNMGGISRYGSIVASNSSIAPVQGGSLGTTNTAVDASTPGNGNFAYHGGAGNRANSGGANNAGVGGAGVVGGPGGGGGGNNGVGDGGASGSGVITGGAGGGNGPANGANGLYFNGGTGSGTTGGGGAGYLASASGINGGSGGGGGGSAVGNSNGGTGGGGAVLLYY